MTIEATIAAIHSRPKSGKKDSQERMKALLFELGHPEENLAPAIHVTGTNGKGSVANMLSAIAIADGLRVGLFTSPYLISFNDRFQINGKDITDDQLISLYQRVEDAVKRVESKSDNRLRPTEFEVVTAIMLCYFADEQIDLAIIEVGIGGRFDSTNILTSTAVAVITSVALDHQRLLGNTIELIAEQKAGIIRKSRPTVVGPDMNSEALAVIEGVCKSNDSQLIVAKKIPFKVSLTGTYQKMNAATAVAAYRAFRPMVHDSVIQEGLLKAWLPGRFEKVEDGIYLDGAHNLAGIHALHESIRQAFDGPVMVIIGALEDKSLSDALEKLEEDSQLDVRLFQYGGLPGRAGMVLSDFDKKRFGQPIASVGEAIALAKEKKEPVFFTGSLYFVADVRRELCQKKKYSAQS